MMTKYVDADALEQMAFGKEHPEFYDGQDIADWYEDCIVNAPAADVAPVVHGEWRFCGSDTWNNSFQCSACGKIATHYSTFCPNCGARMEVI